jgi:hypothetical protein
MDESVLLDIIGTDLSPHKCGRVVYENILHNRKMISTCARLIVEDNEDDEFCNLCQRTYKLNSDIVNSHSPKLNLMRIELWWK